MCLLDNSLYFIVRIKAVLEGRGFKPKTFGNVRLSHPKVRVNYTALTRQANSKQTAFAQLGFYLDRTAVSFDYLAAEV